MKSDFNYFFLLNEIFHLFSRKLITMRVEKWENIFFADITYRKIDIISHFHFPFCRPRRLIIVKMKASLEPKREEWMAWKFMLLLLLATLNEHQEMRKHDGNSKAQRGKKAEWASPFSKFQETREKRNMKFILACCFTKQTTNY